MALGDTVQSTLFIRRAAQYEIKVCGIVAKSDVQVTLYDGQAPYPRDMYAVDTIQILGSEWQINVVLKEDAPIGEYTLRVVNVADAASWDLMESNVVILVNPYSSRDAAFEEDADLRTEYVERTEGVIWLGSDESNTAKLMEYDQFNPSTVAVAMRSLRRMPVADRGNLVLVSRHLSYALGKDVCYGKWSEPYTTGTWGYKCDAAAGQPCRRPGAWTSMTTLFELHLKLNQPVQFCQCWVYASVMNAVGRSLGIPTRPVTVFKSAHDTDQNRAMDHFYTMQDGAVVRDRNVADETGLVSSDSVWNFHAWNEMIFKRDDIDCDALGMDVGCANGWQAVDATPQEGSYGGSGLPVENGRPGGGYQMGPAALKIIKANKHPTCQAQLDSFPSDEAVARRFGCYDHEFVIGEVNANLNLWVQDDTKPTGWRLLETMDPDKQTAVTKRPGSMENCDLSGFGGSDCLDAFKIDVSSNYKVPEPSLPGLPLLPTCAQAGAPFYCSGPKFQWNAAVAASSGRSLEAQPMQADPNGVVVQFGSDIHMQPAFSRPVVNKQGHPDSSLTLSLSLSLPAEATNSASVVCFFLVTATNGRGEVVNGHDSVVGKITSRLTVQPGEEAVCSAHIPREEYVRFASIANDMNLDIDATASVGNGSQIVAFERIKALCTPLLDASGDLVLTATGFECEGTTGSYSGAIV